MNVWLGALVRRDPGHGRAGPAVDRLRRRSRRAAIKESLKWLELLLALRDRRRPGARAARGARGSSARCSWRAPPKPTYGAVQFVTGSGPGAFAAPGRAARVRPLRPAQSVRGLSDDDSAAGGVMALSRANPRPFRWLSLGASGVLLRRHWPEPVARRLAGRGRGRGLPAAGLEPHDAPAADSVRAGRRVLAAGAGRVGAAAGGDSRPRWRRSIEYFGVFDVRTVEVTQRELGGRRAHGALAGRLVHVPGPPVAGRGRGQLRRRRIRPTYVGMWREALGHAHNYYLNMLAELGVVGGALLLLLLGLLFVSWAARCCGSEGQSRHVLAGGAGRRLRRTGRVLRPQHV